MAHDDLPLDSADAQEVEPQEETNEVKRAVPAWIISFVVHLMVLGLLSLIVYAAREDTEEPAVRTTQLPVPPKLEEPKVERDIKPSDIQLDIEETEVTTPSPVNPLDVPVETPSAEEEEVSDVPLGREDAIASSEMGNEGALMTIGPAGNAAGMFGSRSGGGKKRALGKFGGSRISESTVDAALRWFKKHQSPNGQWDVDGYPANCQENPKCEPGANVTDIGGDVAGTGYAILCYLGAGYDHRMQSRYKATVKKGLDWLVSVQKPDGAFECNNYGHNYVQGIGAMALAEAYAMTSDPALKGPAQLSIDMILKRQTPDKAGGYGLGWDYLNPNPARADASVSGWCVMALKSGAAGGLNVGNGMEGAKQYLERAWKAANKDFKPVDPYTDETSFPYAWNSENDAVVIERGNHHDMAPVGALMSVFLGKKADDPMLNSLANYIMKHQFPTAYPCNTYYMYYNTLAIFQVGGERWQKWNKTCRDMLIGAQRKGDGCFDGSWDSQGTLFAGHEVGRIFSTAYCCLSLEVYYRYLPVGQGGKKR